MNSTKNLIDNYNNYISKNKELGLYNKNNSDKYWGNIESPISSLFWLGEYSNKGLSFFDIGCGGGQILNFTKNLGFHKVSGIELDKELCEICKENGFEVINDNIINNELKVLKEFDILYFYCFAKNNEEKQFILNKICNKMKVNAIIKVLLCEINRKDFKEINKGLYKKIKYSV